MMLKITEFGNPILRQKARRLSVSEIKSEETQQLIADMKETLIGKKLGVGLAAQQVGHSVAISIIELSASPLRDAEPVSLVIINPEIIETFGYRKQLWEGCISGGPGKAGLFAKVPRYKKVTLHYYDENGQQRTKEFDGLTAHVIQHEVDHLNGLLFVDKVKDTKSYMTFKEYKKMSKKL